MKHYRLFRGQYYWFTDIGLRIAKNDLLNNIRDVLKEYKRTHANENHTTNINIDTMVSVRTHL